MKRVPSTKLTRLGGKLRQIRQHLGLSQNELLDRLGFSEQLFRSNVSQYERGDRIPSPVVLLAYARLAKIDLAVLIDDELDIPEAFLSNKSAPRTTKPAQMKNKRKRR